MRKARHLRDGRGMVRTLTSDTDGTAHRWNRPSATVRLWECRRCGWRTSMAPMVADGQRDCVALPDEGTAGVPAWA